nr:peptidase [uncultured Serratia sp.]DAM25245.1 MAG TPA: stabilization protein [Caudoviricetes sp.]
MNLLERLIHHRLCSETPADGGEGGGGTTPAAAVDTPADGTASGDPANGDTPAGEEKPAAEKTAEELAAEKAEKDAADKAEKGKKPAAPEKYEFVAPEGQELDANALSVFEPIAKELGLTQEQAQKLVDIYPQIQQQQAEAWSKQGEEWREQVKSDKEIGGDKYTANVGNAQKALDQFGSPALREYLETTLLGNHPELVRFFAKVGKAVSEDTMVMPNNGGQLSAADVLYGNKG